MPRRKRVSLARKHKAEKGRCSDSCSKETEVASTSSDFQNQNMRNQNLGACYYVEATNYVEYSEFPLCLLTDMHFINELLKIYIVTFANCTHNISN
ncbi:hypothetical protein NPIL_556711 [Nephila pilipes]|uniref:Uncharacterized protein n=1 Tax=Nephila pilipes TaxID=299642 RepID=A0A8X6PBZ8_NEPPI|nr:hypothetical protein NPIL_556711 [Nephila pilipes]